MQTARTQRNLFHVALPNGATYRPGVTQHLVVTVADLARKRWGFQLTACPQTAHESENGGAWTAPATGVGRVVIDVAGNARLYQMAVKIPSSIPVGDQPVVAQVSGMQSPSSLLLSVQR